MYPECRHVKSSGRLCDSPALSGSNWCYFHTRLHERQVATQRAQAEALDGRGMSTLSDSSSRPEQSAAEESAVSVQTIDRSDHPVTGQSGPWGNSPLELPPLEDAASIQLALIEVAQALAANRIDTKRAGLLLYALQVASANAKNLNLSKFGVRTITYSDEGLPLAPQRHGRDH